MKKYARAKYKTNFEMKFNLQGSQSFLANFLEHVYETILSILFRKTTFFLSSFSKIVVRFMWKILYWCVFIVLECKANKLFDGRVECKDLVCSNKRDMKI